MPAKTRLLRLCASAYDPTQLHAFFRYPNAASKRQNRLKLPIILIQINQLAWSDPFDPFAALIFDRPFDRPSERLLLTPHVGYVTRETYQVFYPQTVEAVLAWLEGKPVRVIPS